MWFAPGLITPDSCRCGSLTAFAGRHPIGVSLSQLSLGKTGAVDASPSHPRVHSGPAADGQRPTGEDLRMGGEEPERRPYEASPLVIPQGPRHDDDAVVRVG